MIAGVYAGNLPQRDRDAFEYMLSEEVRAALPSHKRPVAPLRPIGLPDDNDELLTLLRRAKGSRAKSDTELLKLFVGWRAGVWAVEDRAHSSITCLLFSARTYDRLGSFEAELLQVSTFLLEEHGLSVPPFLSGMELQRAVNKASRFEDVLPLWLREGQDARPRRARTDAPSRPGAAMAGSNSPHWTDEHDDDT